MMRFLRRVIEDIKQGENIDLIVTVTLGLLIAVFNVLGIAPQGLVSSLTLATLGLIAIGLLVTRYKIEDIYHKEKTSSTVQFELRQPPSIREMIAEAKEIWMVGLILRNTTTNNFYNFKKSVSEGGRIRALVVDLDKVDVENIVRRFSRAATPDHFRADFAHVVTQYKEFRQSASNPDNVQLRLLDFVPSYSLYIFPRAEDGGAAYIEIYGYKSQIGSVPKFRVTKRDNPEWYKHFVDQFELMFSDAQPAPL